MTIRSLARNRALFGILLAGLLGLFAAGLFAYWRSPTRGLPYKDSFARGEVQEWQAFGGTWGAVNGSMRNDSDERGAKLLTGSTHWQDYSIEGDVMLLGLGGDAGFLVRSSDEEEGVDAYRGYYAGLRKKERPTYPAAVVAVTQGDFGDTNFNSHTHHGTEAERGNAVVRGFEAAFREGKSLAQAIEESTNYVLTL